MIFDSRNRLRLGVVFSSLLLFVGSCGVPGPTPDPTQDPSGSLQTIYVLQVTGGS